MIGEHVKWEDFCLFPAPYCLTAWYSQVRCSACYIKLDPVKSVSANVAQPFSSNKAARKCNTFSHRHPQFLVKVEQNQQTSNTCQLIPFRGRLLGVGTVDGCYPFGWFRLGRLPELKWRHCAKKFEDWGYGRSTSKTSVWAWVPHSVNAQLGRNEQRWL